MWYTLSNDSIIDTPALAIYPDRVKENIQTLKTFVQDVNRLRPHVKTIKSPEVVRLMMEAGLSKFKCATIAEAEMLATVGAVDVLLAYQPTGPKIERFVGLIKKFPSTTFSCLIDNFETATALSNAGASHKLTIQVWIDLNIGMNRTGIKPDAAFDLIRLMASLPGIQLIGLHAYDGHLRDTDLNIRTEKCDAGYKAVENLREKIIAELKTSLKIVAGGTPTFPIHAKRAHVECSPGTFIFWDTGYGSILKEQPFQFAALVLTRIVSKPDENILCLDLGHKSIASENPLPNRVSFLNAPELEAIGHSEEHLVVKTNDWNKYKVGDVLYGVPFHVCPTVALHDFGWAVKNGKASEQWSIVARKRKIEI